jgi:HK97 family phage major capsid protein
MSIRDLLEKRAALVQEMRTITNGPAGDGGDLSAEQAEKFNSMKAQLESVEKQLERQRLLDEAERRMNGESLSGHGDNRLDDALRDYSLRRALAGAAGLEVDWSRERELSLEIAKRAGRPFNGLAIPISLFTHAPYEKRVVTTLAPVGGPGGNIIASDFRPDQYIDILRPNSVVYLAGATMLTGLVGNVVIPALTKSAGFEWIGENSALTPADPEHGQVTLTPKHGGSIVEFSRNLLLQSSPDIETLLRRDMARIVATGIDRVAVKGGGSNEPTGILANSDVTDLSPGSGNGSTITWAMVLAFIAAIQNANAVAGGFLTTPAMVKKMRSTVRVGSTDSRMIQEEPNNLAGYALQASTNVPADYAQGSGTNLSAMVFGDFSEVLIGVWSELDILVNPYETTAYSKGNVQIRAMATLDVALRHPEAFAIQTDFLTT